MGDFKNYDFGQADTNAQDGSELIPDGVLAWAIVTVRPYSAAKCLTPSKSSDGEYLDVELTILEGPYARRKVWDRIGLEGSAKWVARGMSSVRHILEVGRQMTNYEAGQPGYRLGSSGARGDMVFMELNELRCAIKVGIEKGKDSYPDKNIVRAYLSPNPASESNKNFMKLVNGETAPPPPKAAAAPKQSSWATGQATAQPQQRQPTGRPAWADAPPSRTSAPAEDDKIPF